MAFECDRERAKRIAGEAMERIKALDLAPDPANFEFWFTYCAGTNGALNNAANALLAATPRPAQHDWEALCDQYVSSGRLVEQVRTIGGILHDRTTEVAFALDNATVRAGGYGGELANAVRDIQRAEDRDQLRSTVARLLQSTADIRETNARLQHQLSESAAQVYELQERLQAVQYESMLDPLTSVANRRLFDAALVRMISDAEAHDEPISLLLVDVDYFKQFNDRHGHLVGDDVLRLVSAAIKQNCRRDDLVCRYGGDEFAVILPRTPVQGAFAVAENIRAGIMERELRRRSTNETLGRLTVSVGLAQRQPGQSPDELLERADAWLYAAKRDGRNRVALAFADGTALQDAPTGHVPDRLVWQKAYECGNSIIDAEHRELFDLANVLFDPALKPEASLQAFDTAVEKMMSHLAKHFADEEAELGKRQYRDLTSHRSEHARLLADAGQLRSAIASGTKTLGDLREFLVNTVVAEHTLNADREFFAIFA